MAAELAYAEELGIPVKVFNSIGIPRERWNSERYADSPDYTAARETGKGKGTL